MWVEKRLTLHANIDRGERLLTLYVRLPGFGSLATLLYSNVIKAEEIIHLSAGTTDQSPLAGLP